MYLECMSEIITAVLRWYRYQEISTGYAAWYHLWQTTYRRETGQGAA